MDDIKLALLGDKEAEQRLTDAGGVDGDGEIGGHPWTKRRLSGCGLGVRCARQPHLLHQPGSIVLGVALPASQWHG